MNSNKLIAEFMGLPYKEHELSYNVSWDWLMTVVEKIESLRDPNGNAYRFTIDMCNAQIEGTRIEVLGGAYKIDVVYKAVVEFINQYGIYIYVDKNN